MGENMFHPRRALGKTGFVATQLGIGDLATRGVSIDELATILRRAMDKGLNLVDTAPAYEDGYSEEVVGAALRGRRDGMFVVDKVDNLSDPVAPQVEASLRRLKMDATDVFLFHSVSTTQQWRNLATPGGGMEQLEECRRAGKTRFKGISSHEPEVLVEALESGLCDVVMFAIGPFCDRAYEEVVLPLARRKKVGTIGIKTFGASKLLGDASIYGAPLEGRAAANFSNPALPHLTVEQCVRYTLTIDPDVALLGLSTPEEQDAAFEAALRFQPMSHPELAKVRQAACEAVRGKGTCWWNPAHSRAV